MPGKEEAMSDDKLEEVPGVVKAPFLGLYRADKGSKLDTGLCSGVRAGRLVLPYSAIVSILGAVYLQLENKKLVREIAALDKMQTIVRGSSNALVSKAKRPHLLRPKQRKAFVVQAVVLRKDKFDDFDDALSWIQGSGFVNKGVIERPASWRFPQREEGIFERLRSKRVNSALSLIGGPLY